jgi:hypothetical protein
MNKEIIFSAKEYKEKYNDLLESYLLEYEDYEDIDFINNEIKRYTDFIKDLDWLVSYKFAEASGMPVDYERLIDERLSKKCDTDFLDWIEDKTEKLLILSFNYIIKFLELQKEQLTIQPQQVGASQINSLNWQGTPLQFTELTKALFETNLVSPEMNQNEFFKRMKLFFNVNEFNESDKLKDIRKRTNTTTPLLNILETSINNWIKSKD